MRSYGLEGQDGGISLSIYGERSESVVKPATPEYIPGPAALSEGTSWRSVEQKTVVGDCPLTLSCSARPGSPGCEHLSPYDVDCATVAVLDSPSGPSNCLDVTSQQRELRSIDLQCKVPLTGGIIAGTIGHAHAR